MTHDLNETTIRGKIAVLHGQNEHELRLQDKLEAQCEAITVQRSKIPLGQRHNRKELKKKLRRTRADLYASRRRVVSNGQTLDQLMKALPRPRAGVPL